MHKRWLTSIPFWCLLSLAGLAQPGGAAKQADDSDSHLITLDIVAADKSGQPVAGLTEQDFTVLDNTRPQKIVSFRAVESPTADLPVELVLVVDEVNDSLVNVAYAKDQISKFLRTNGGKFSMPVSLVFFSDSGATIGGEPSVDASVLLAELNKDRTPLHTILRSQGPYGQNDRFELSLRAIEQLIDEESPRPGRKLMVWISPGWPFLDFLHVDPTRKTRQQIFNTIVGLSARLREARITLYSVDPLGVSRSIYYQEFLSTIKDASQAQHGNLGLQVLASRSGGLVLTANNDIASEIATCISDANAYYVLSFEAAAGDGPNEFHSLDIRIDKPGVSARTRSGYYAEQMKPRAVSPLDAFRDREPTQEELVPPPEVPVPSPPVPSEEYKNQMIGRLVVYARQYVYNLPDFICDQITKRYTNLEGYTDKGNPKFGAQLHYGDTITADLAFAAGIQQERVTFASNQNAPAEPAQGQSLSNGEFGRDMALILGVNVDPELTWDRWEMLHGKLAAVFSYFVPLPKSQYRLFYCCFTKPGIGQFQQSYTAPIRGSIYVDPATGVISRLIIKAVNLPSTFHVNENNTIIDYNEISIGGREYVLPVAAKVFVRADSQKNRNEISFVMYRKFDPESTFSTINSKITYKK